MTICVVWRAAACAAMVALSLLAPPAGAQVSEAVAERVMRDSGLWAQLADIGPHLKQGFEDLARKPPPEIGPDGPMVLQRLATVTDDAFGPLALRLAVRREVAQRLVPAKMPALEGWLASPLGRKVTAMEVAKSAERGEEATFMQAGERQLAAASPERRSLLQVFVETSRSAEAASGAMLNLMIALQTGPARAMGRVDVPSLQAMREQMEPQRRQMQLEMAPVMLSLAADMYADLPDGELRSYLAFQASEAGRHLTDVVIRAQDAAVAQAAEELVRLVATR